MPQNVCGGCILHVMAFAFVFTIGSNVSSVSKMGNFKNFELEEVGHFKNKARDQLSLMQSCAKYILHIFFGAFQVTPRNIESLIKPVLVHSEINCILFYTLKIY